MAVTEIRYTEDGSTPTGSSLLYSAPVVVSSSKTLKAKAFKTGYNSSILTTGVYVITALHTSVYPPVQNDVYVKATTVWDNFSYAASNATDPTQNLTGTEYGQSWMSQSFVGTEQRFHIDLGTSKVITQIYYENLCLGSSDSSLGVRNFTLWGSNTAGDFADLVYWHDGTWAPLISSESVFIQHSYDASHTDPRYITVSNTTAYRYYAFKFADSYGGYIGGFQHMGVRRIELQVST